MAVVVGKYEELTDEELEELMVDLNHERERRVTPEDPQTP